MSSSIDLKETADASTWGHVCFGETRACTALVASTNHASSLVRGKPGRAGQGNPDPMVLMGYKAGEPVYRTTTALANALEGEHPGSYQLHEPALFPDVLIVECGLTQADITVRTEFCSPISLSVSHNFAQEQEQNQDFGENSMNSNDEEHSNNSHDNQR
ncbi:unnamed protein product, partial [Rotaria socialis]